MKYLLLVHYKNNKSESYYADNPDILRNYAETSKFASWEVYELNKTVYSYKEVEFDELNYDWLEEDF